MKRSVNNRAAMLGVVVLLSAAPVTRSRVPVRIRYPDLAPGAELTPAPSLGNTRGPGMTRLDPELRVLYAQQLLGRGPQPKTVAAARRLTARLLGVNLQAQLPTVQVAVYLRPGSSAGTLAKQTGLLVHLDQGDLVAGSIPITSLLSLAEHPSVVSIQPLKPRHLPIRPDLVHRRTPLLGLPRGAGRAAPSPMSFNHHGLTGKGVIIGVIDSGIDWRHPDFRNPGGSTRILYLYDETDASWSQSGGKIGTRPPLTVDQGRPFGTLYTQAQINAALKGRGAVNSTVPEGHGTACAGTAAGNGRATADGVPAGTYRGVAPQADLIIVKYDFRSPENYPADWIFRMARARHQPCVISMSFGSQHTAHDGTEADEQSLNRMIGRGKPGVALCVAAGNDAGEDLHAGGRFGPRRAGEIDVESEPIELFVPNVPDGTRLLGYFDHRDDWGLGLLGLLNPVGKDQPVLHVFHHESDGQSFHEEVVGLSSGRKITLPAQESEQLRQIYQVQHGSNNLDQVQITLPPGPYNLWGYGVTDRVVSGRFDLYLPLTDDHERTIGSFGKGAQTRSIVASPGNAGAVLTVGSYDFRDRWVNRTGQTTRFNLQLGAISDYSSVGFRRDGVVKPDLAAPGQFMISSLARGSDMARDDPDHMVTRDGYHLAWAGTSSATPFCAGVVALMLQKNPALDAAQIKRILIRTARRDPLTGALPNIEWGYGKIDPDRALRATPGRSPMRRWRGAARVLPHRRGSERHVARQPR